MNVCPSCGEPLELIEAAGLRDDPAEDGVAPAGAEHPGVPKPKMLCSVCSWPVEETRP
jgi:hypothetical protein